MCQFNHHSASIAASPTGGTSYLPKGLCVRIACTWQVTMTGLFARSACLRIAAQSLKKEKRLCIFPENHKSFDDLSENSRIHTNLGQVPIPQTMHFGGINVEHVFREQYSRSGVENSRCLALKLSISVLVRPAKIGGIS